MKIIVEKCQYSFFFFLSEVDYADLLLYKLSSELFDYTILVKMAKPVCV